MCLFVIQEDGKISIWEWQTNFRWRRTSEFTFSSAAIVTATILNINKNSFYLTWIDTLNNIYVSNINWKLQQTAKASLMCK